MTEFWIYSAMLIALSLAFVLLPLLKKGPKDVVMSGASDNRREQNIKIFKERLKELEKEVASGGLDKDTFNMLKTELEAGLLDDVDSLGDDSHNSLSEKNSQPLLFLSATVSIVVVAVSTVLYFKLGAYDDQKQLQSMRFAPAEIEQARAAAESGDMSLLVNQLYEKLKSAPDNVEGWMLLSRTAMNIENYALATEGFETVIKSLEGRGEDSSSVYGLLAQARYFESGGMSISAQAAVSQALKMNPEEVNSIGLKAIHAFDQKRYAEAAGLWEGLLAFAPEHPARISIETGISRARSMSAMVELPNLAQSDKAMDGSDSGGKAVPSSIEVSVSLSKELADNFAPTDVVFVFARAVNGPPMPLAASKHQLSDLPLTVVLDDSRAMTPQLRLSSVDEVSVMARVSKSGQPIAQAGDVQSETLLLPTRGAPPVSLILDQAVR